jgi:hypothetical protein
MSSDETIYLKATNEVEGDLRDPALWAKSMAICDGNKQKAKYQYIRFRVEILKVEQNKEYQSEPPCEIENSIYDEKKQKEKLTIEALKIKGYLANKNTDDSWNIFEPQDFLRTIHNDQSFYEYASKILIDTLPQNNNFDQDTKSNRHYSSISHSHKNINYFTKLINGDFGLAKTYWLFGVVVGVVTQLIIIAVPSRPLFLILFFGFRIYEVPLLIGIWRASNKYIGNEFWSGISKFAVVVAWVLLVYELLIISGG